MDKFASVVDVVVTQDDERVFSRVVFTSISDVDVTVVSVKLTSLNFRSQTPSLSKIRFV